MQSGEARGGGDSEWHERPEIGPRDCRGRGKLWCFQGCIKSSRGGACGGEMSRGPHVLTAPKCQHTWMARTNKNNRNRVRTISVDLANLFMLKEIISMLCTEKCVLPCAWRTVVVIWHIKPEHAEGGANSTRTTSRKVPREEAALLSST